MELLSKALSVNKLLFGVQKLDADAGSKLNAD
jgi:hypothetical protein